MSEEKRKRSMRPAWVKDLKSDLTRYIFEGMSPPVGEYGCRYTHLFRISHMEARNHPQVSVSRWTGVANAKVYVSYVTLAHRLETDALSLQARARAAGLIVSHYNCEDALGSHMGCVEPSHLKLDTPRNNALMLKQARLRTGNAYLARRLTDEEIEYMHRLRCVEFSTFAEISHILKINRDTVSKLWHGSECVICSEPEVVEPVASYPISYTAEAMSDLDLI